MTEEIEGLKAENACLKARIAASDAAICAVLDLHHTEVLRAQQLEQEVRQLRTKAMLEERAAKRRHEWAAHAALDPSPTGQEG